MYTTTQPQVSVACNIAGNLKDYEQEWKNITSDEQEWKNITSDKYEWVQDAV